MIVIIPIILLSVDLSVSVNSFDSFYNTGNDGIELDSIIDTGIITSFLGQLLSLGFLVNAFCLVSTDNNNWQLRSIRCLTRSFTPYSNFLI